VRQVDVPFIAQVDAGTDAADWQLLDVGHFILSSILSFYMFSDKQVDFKF
jgi:hypothetical protein